MTLFLLVVITILLFVFFFAGLFLISEQKYFAAILCFCWVGIMFMNGISTSKKLAREGQLRQDIRNAQPTFIPYNNPDAVLSPTLTPVSTPVTAICLQEGLCVLPDVITNDEKDRHFDCTLSYTTKPPTFKCTEK